jgi:hypothetical protein
MRILIYKRTHRGDPDASGVFGIRDCMGRVRDLAYDAVIGIGGIGTEPKACGIGGKINWIGIGPHKVPAPSKKGPLVTFDHFRFYDKRGPDFVSEAPNLARRMYGHNVRILLHNMAPQEREEATAIVSRAYRAQPSRGPLPLRSAVPKTQSCKTATRNAVTTTNAAGLRRRAKGMHCGARVA